MAETLELNRSKELPRRGVPVSVWLSFGFVVLIMVFAVLGSVITPYDASEQRLLIGDSDLDQQLAASRGVKFVRVLGGRIEAVV